MIINYDVNWLRLCEQLVTITSSHQFDFAFN